LIVDRRAYELEISVFASSIKNQKSSFLNRQSGVELGRLIDSRVLGRIALGASGQSAG
jgi:hypothetical protein